MARTVVVDRKKNTRMPYLRGILTRSLQNTGLEFQQAYLLASNLRDQISHLEEISTEELRNRMAQMLTLQCESSVHKRYLAKANGEHTVMVRGIDGNTLPFSRGLHHQLLESLGIPDQKARSITARLHQQFQSACVIEIDYRQLGHLTYQAILESADSRLAQFYLIWSAFRFSERPLIVLIGGVPGCGKSTVSVELASRMQIIRTQSTDMLREVMRMMMPERLSPVLHTSSFNAWTALPESDSNAADHYRAVANGYYAQAELLSVPCEAVVRRALRENISLILEGVHIQPKLLEKLPKNDTAIMVPMILAVPNPEDLRQRIQCRDGLVPQRRAERYLRHFDGIWHLQSLLLAEADELGVPIVSNNDRESAVQSAARTIIEAIEPEFDVDVEAVFGPAVQYGLA